MDTCLLNWLWNNRRLIGVVAIIISIATWALELTDLVYVCPYCRTQRTIIGLLGLSLLLPNTRNWINLYLASTVAAFGFFVAAYQHFEGWKKIMFGKFEWGEHWYISPWLLSGFALFIISGLLLLIWTSPRAAKHVDSE
ncbi:disulfide bond formation protein B [Rheinheimera metallidurans]|uniref:disulfide bond formation protein B n=1 Tax=Rheinheimera metallidurans TaxID=2925781 RepID=UPI00300139D7